MAATDLLTCAKCGQGRPATDFDQRFIGKGTRIMCRVCRGVRDEQAKWQDAWERRREVERRQREEVAGHRARDEHRAALAARGFTLGQQEQIVRAEQLLRDTGRPWAEIRSEYLALDPPYRGSEYDARHSRRSQADLGQSIRERIFAQQDGRCFYCQRELLPLSVWRKSPDGRSAIDLLPQQLRNNRADSGIPELDHKIPLTRGGTSALDNLAYACRRCNQLKGVRTEAEFRAYPDDPVTRLGIHPTCLEFMLSMEDRHDWEPLCLPKVSAPTSPSSGA